MRRRWGWVVALVIVCLASCDESGANPSPSPSPFEFKTPSGLVLAAADLPTGYRVNREGSLGAFDISEMLTPDGRSSSRAADALIKQGLWSSYVRSFDHESFANRGVASVVMLFRDPESARVAARLLFGYARDFGCEALPIGVDLGDAAGECDAIATYDDKKTGKTQVSVTFIYFAVSNAVAYIGMYDDPAVDDSEYLASLAEQQLKAMRSFGGSDPAIKRR